MTAALDIQYEWFHKIRSVANPPFPTRSPDVDPQKYLFGGTFGPGDAWRNQLLYRAGLEYEMNASLTLRGGYIYGRTPIPRDATFANLHVIFAQQSIATFGATWKFKECQELSVVFINGFTHNIKGKNSIPATLNTATPQGLVQLPINEVVGPNGLTGERAGGEADIKQRVYGIGLAYGYVF